MTKGSTTGVIIQMPSGKTKGKIRDDVGTLFEFVLPDERIYVPTSKRKTLVKKGARVLFVPGAHGRASNIRVSISSHKG